MREESAIGGFEILAMLTDLVASRLPTIAAVAAGGPCPPEMKEAVTSVIWASPFVGAHVPEFVGIKAQIQSKFGPTFVELATTNRELSVHEQLRASFDPVAPSELRCIKYIESICSEFCIPIDPDALHGDGVLGARAKKAAKDEDDDDAAGDGDGDDNCGFSTHGFWIPYVTVPRDETEAKLLALKRAWS
jgi:vacuolar protein sorting-associated protein IST1